MGSKTNSEITVQSSILQTMIAGNTTNCEAVLLDKLITLDLEEYAIEVIRQVHNKEFRSQKGPLASWSAKDVVEWVSQINLDNNRLVSRAVAVLEDQCVDGPTLLNMTNAVWEQELNLDYSLLYILRTIIEGWELAQDNTSGAIGDLSETVTDLSHCSRDTAMQLIQLDRDCEQFGIGSVYGQVTVLGWKEAQDKRGEAVPIGTHNDTFVLWRRKVANGTKESDMSTTSAASLPPLAMRKTIEIPHTAPQLKLDSTAEEEGDITVLHLASDPSRDVFQIGRAANGGNDFMVRGAVHANKEGCAVGPVSRYACRIECERLPPFRAFIKAGGFDPITQKIVTAHAYGVQQRGERGASPTADGFTTFGVRIYRPEDRRWLEVSVRGRTFNSRRLPAQAPSLPVVTDLGNQLTDGTIIDLGGVCLLYRCPVAMAKAPQADPTRAVDLLNALRPHCPVLFNDISFSYVDARERLYRAQARAYDAGALAPVPSGLQVPIADYSHVPEGNRPYVFPACGHIFSYHRSLEGRSCPLCRREGAFVPIAFAFEPAICDQFPTHVFNPCGHVASLETCERWAAQPMPQRDVTLAGHVHLCPYCATELSAPPMGPAYSRLCLQTESDTAWPSPDAHNLFANTGDGADRHCQQGEEPATTVADTYAAGDPALHAVICSQQALWCRQHGEQRERRATGTTEAEAEEGDYVLPSGRPGSLRKRFPTFAPQLVEEGVL